MKSQKGQALVETALILPILILILFGITDFGRIFHAYLTLEHAGGEAARAATIGEDDGHISDKIFLATRSLDANIESKLIITITPEGSTNRMSGSDVTIKLKYPIDFLTPIIGQLIGKFDLENTTVMRVE